jgi:hypothetical protein
VPKIPPIQSRLDPPGTARAPASFEGVPKAIGADRSNTFSYNCSVPPPAGMDIPLPAACFHTPGLAGTLLLRAELPPHQKLLLVIGYHLGMRSGEILGLRWNQVGWKANLIRLEKRQTKGKQARNAPLYGELQVWFDMAHADPKRGQTIICRKGRQDQRDEDIVEESLWARWSPRSLRS